MEVADGSSLSALEVAVDLDEVIVPAALVEEAAAAEVVRSEKESENVSVKLTDPVAEESEGSAVT